MGSTPPRFARLPLLWVSTLKFKIVVIAVVTAVVAAGLTAHLVLQRMLAETQRMLLQQVADERERTAALLGSKVEMLQTSVAAIAAELTPAALTDRAAAEAFLIGKPGVGALFDSVFVALRDGTMLARV